MNSFPLVIRLVSAFSPFFEGLYLRYSFTIK